MPEAEITKPEANDCILQARDLPWRGNDIYLEDFSKNVKAVCSNADVAKYVADAVNAYASMHCIAGSKTDAYRNFLQASYYLYVTMSKAKIPVDNIETLFLQKAFEGFCSALDVLVKRYGVKIENTETPAESK